MKFMKTAKKILITVAVFAVFAASSFAAITITSAQSIKGNCFTAGQDLTITINASHSVAWASLRALVVASSDATLDYNNNSGVPDECLWGLVSASGNPPDNTPPWQSNAILAAGTASGASVTGYQLVVPVPAGYTLNGPKRFFVIIGTSSSALELGQYYSTSFEQTSILLNECSLDTATATPTITPTLYAIWNCAWGSWGNQSCAPVELQVVTNTNTPTRTPTPTSTQTMTATPTRTSTETSTQTMTSTPTRTSTPTITITLWESMTITPTNTPTPTFTQTSTVTFTATETITYTSTPTATPTSTITVTNTYTPTVTLTPIFSSTNTPTATPTATVTITFTNTPTATPTSTVTNTATPSTTFTITWTITETVTQTSTPTVTETATPTSTASPTPTITPTLPPFPYVITIGVYNSAGELVRTVAHTRTSAIAMEMKLVSNNTETEIVTSYYPLTIILPGVETPDSIGLGSTSFDWNTVTDGLQGIGNGIYYLKLEQKDEYGHINVLIEEIQVLRHEQYVELRVFNSAGELVRTIREQKPAKLSNVALKVICNNKAGEVVGINKDGTSQITVKYGEDTSDFIVWDGKNAAGMTVSSGTYEMQVIIVTPDGRSIQSSKSVIILNEGNNYLEEVKAYPNPYVGKSRSFITIAWKGKDNKIPYGDAVISIYNAAGELIARLTEDASKLSVKWNMKTAGGDNVSQGYYICVVELKNNEGYLDRKWIKIAVKDKK